jgi:hypothetical protein
VSGQLAETAFLMPGCCRRRRGRGHRAGRRGGAGRGLRRQGGRGGAGRPNPNRQGDLR